MFLQASQHRLRACAARLLLIGLALHVQKSLQKFESRDKRMRTDKLEDRARQQMIGAHHKAEVINNKDRYSLEHPKFPKHMLVAVSSDARRGILGTGIIVISVNV